MALTVKEIAKLAGVSRGTVDRALNNRGGVSPEVERRIKKIAKEHGYTPNRFGKALAMKVTPLTIGVVINSMGNPFFEEVFRGINDANDELSDFGLDIIILEDKGYDPTSQCRNINKLVEKGVDGIAITPINDIRVAECLKSSHLPVITFNQDIDGIDKICFVGCDYENSGRTAGQLMGLISADETNIGIITGSVKMLGHNKRIHGFSRAIKEQYPNLHIVDIVENNDDDNVSYNVTKDLLSKHKNINALFLTAAGVAGTIRATNELGFGGRIICFDDTDDIKRFVADGKIQATICQHPYEQGYRAIKILFDALSGVGLPEKNIYYTRSEIKIKENIFN